MNPIISRSARCYLAWWAEHWKTRHPKGVDAVVSRNWDALLLEILSAYNDQAKEEDSFWRVVLHEAVACERCDVIECLVRKGWDVDLDALLSYAASSGVKRDSLLRDAASSGEKSLKTIERLCWLGAGGITDYWGACIRLNGQIATYEILLESNVVSPRMWLCGKRDLDEIPHQLSLAFWLDIPEDRCKKRGSWFSVFYHVREDEHGDVLDIVELCSRNGGPITVWPSLLKELPKAGPRVSAIIAAALQPASLRSLCRKAVRRVGPKRKFKSWVEKLELPGPLSGYLCSSKA